MQVDLPIGGTVGQGRSLNANSGENLNCYIEVTNDGKPCLIGTPGLNYKITFPSSPIRGCYSDSSVSYWVAGNDVYKVNADLSFNRIGGLLTNAAPVNFASSGLDIMIVDGTFGYYIHVATDVVTQITDPDFPANPVDVAYWKSYFLVTIANSQVFYLSEKSLIATDWNGLDFATAEGNPDKTAALEIYQDEAVFIGYRSVEVWGFTGNVNFPMQRNTGVVIDRGCTAPRSVARVDDSLIWLGGNNNGRNVIYRMTGYSVDRISTHEIEQQIAKLSFTDDAFSMTYQQEGHSFYIIQFPSANYTLCFDTSTGLWHRRSYNEPSTGADNFWRGSALCFNNQFHLVGDIENGNVYSLELDTYTDNGALIVRQRETTVSEQLFNSIFYKSIRFYIEQGTGNQLPPGDDPKINLQWSNDSGHTWSNWRTISTGKTGQYGVVPQIYGLGIGRQRVWRIRFTEACKFVLMGIVIDIEQGVS